jgi:hypothetical protein
MRSNPKLNVEKVIGELAVGEALVSFLDEKGQPSIVERASVLPPQSQIGPVTPDLRRQVISQSVLYGHYERIVDRESAFEMLRARAQKIVPPETMTREPVPERRPVRRPRDTLLEAMAKSTARSIGSSLGRQVMRGILGSIFGGSGR